jgi:hypothetical protein
MTNPIDAWLDRVAARVVQTAIVKLEELPKESRLDTFLENFWEEYCMHVQIDGLSVSTRMECLVRDAIESSIEDVNYEDVVGLWLRTPQGRTFRPPAASDKIEFFRCAPNAARAVAASLIPDLDALAHAYVRISVDGEHPFRFNVNTDFG